MTDPISSNNSWLSFFCFSCYPTLEAKKEDSNSPSNTPTNTKESMSEQGFPTQDTTTPSMRKRAQHNSSVTTPMELPKADPKQPTTKIANSIQPRTDSSFKTPPPTHSTEHKTPVKKAPPSNDPQEWDI